MHRTSSMSDFSYSYNAAPVFSNTDFMIRTQPPVKKGPKPDNGPSSPRRVSYYIYICMYFNVYKSIAVNVHVCVYIYIGIYICIYINVYMYTGIRAKPHSEPYFTKKDIRSFIFYYHLYIHI
jgi:hypothetical protein